MNAFVVPKSRQFLCYNFVKRTVTRYVSKPGQWGAHSMERAAIPDPTWPQLGDPEVQQWLETFRTNPEKLT